MRNINIILNNAKQYLKVNPLEWTKLEVAFYTIKTYRKKTNYMCEVLLYKSDEKFVSIHSSSEGRYNLKYVNGFAGVALKNCLEVYTLYNHLKINYNEYIFEENIFNNISALIEKGNNKHE